MKACFLNHLPGFAGVLLLCALTGGPAAMAAQSGQAESRLPEPLWPLVVDVPPDLRHLVRDDSVAVVQIRVGTRGDVLDHVVLGVSHYELVAVLDRALAQAKFQPAMQDGQAVAMDLNATIDLGKAVKGTVQSLNAMETYQSLLSTMGLNPGEFRLCSQEQLDRPLEIIERGQSAGVRDATGNILGGEVWVGFFVDPDGRPRMVRPEDSGQPALEQAALLTVSQFRFKAPKSNGLPTVVRARVLIDFKSTVPPDKPPA